jgi:phage shock protein C
MYCTSCGAQLESQHRFCHQCGTPSGPAAAAADLTPKRLSRPRDDRKVAGVCSGIARYLGVDVSLVRILVVCLTLWPPSVGLIFYIVCWIVMPRDPLALLPPSQSASLVTSPTGTPAVS